LLTLLIPSVLILQKKKEKRIGGKGEIYYRRDAKRKVKMIQYIFILTM